MEAIIEMELVPFNVPDVVYVKEKPTLRQQGLVEGRKIHLSELDAETLDTLCFEFRKAVFQKAQTQLPPTCA